VKERFSKEAGSLAERCMDKKGFMPLFRPVDIFQIAAVPDYSLVDYLTLREMPPIYSP
jgi:hypothetical protein